VTPDRPDTAPPPGPADLSAPADNPGTADPGHIGTADPAEPAASVVLPDTVVRRTDPADVGDPVGKVGKVGRLGGGDRVEGPGIVVEGIGVGTFDELFRLRYEGMVRVAYLLLGSQPEAEDVVQDAFARIELRWSRLDNPEGYLHRCVVNRSHDLLRRRRLEQRFRSLRRDETTELGADELADALAALPPKRRTAVVLKYYAGLREREIAEAMGVRPGTVKSMLHRALAQLREVIER
jgi:RNA polymerase sigma-70 factor (sigma-E family)